MTMRNITLADELIRKTFGTNGIDTHLLKFQMDKTKLLFVIEKGSITAQFDLRENKVIHKIDGDKVPFDVQNDLYQKAQYVRNELFSDPEDDDQMTMDDYDDDIIDAEYSEVEEKEQLTLEGSETLLIESSDDTIENLSNQDMTIDEDEFEDFDDEFKVGDRVTVLKEDGKYYCDTVLKVTSASIYIGTGGTGIRAVGNIRINRNTMMTDDEKYRLLSSNH